MIIMALPIPRDFTYGHLDKPYALSRPSLAQKYLPHYSLGELKNFASQLRAYTSHKESKRGPFNPHYITFPRQRLECDLLDMAGQHQPRYVLCVLDCFTKHAWCEFTTRKDGLSVTQAFQAIYQRMGAQQQIKVLASDSGREFLNQRFQTFLQQHGIEHREQLTHLHGTHVERFIRSLKLLMSKYQTLTRTVTISPPILQRLTRLYNMRPHTAFGGYFSPRQMENPRYSFLVRYFREKNVMKRYPPPTTSKFKPGDPVRIMKLSSSAFEKGYRPRFTEEQFKIQAVHENFPLPLYTLKDDQGQIIRGKFFEFELEHSRETTWGVARILRRRTLRNGVRQVQVEWEGHPNSADWINEADLL